MARTRPLTTSSLAVGRFAVKKGSLRSPRGRLVSSLIVKLLLVLIKQTLWLIRLAEPVMVLNKLYDLSNDRDNLFEQNVEYIRQHIYHISLIFFVIADKLFFTLS